jgi:hypothetical protein
MRAWSRVLGIGLAFQAALGCGDSAKDENKGDNGGSSTGGTGGTPSTGGSISSGGSGKAIGGTGATGGSNIGGAGAAGSNIGGASATGGSNTGGTGATGGSNTGGVGGTGGSTGGSSSGSGGGGQLPENPLCEPFARHVAAECPDAWRYEDGISHCNDGFEYGYAMGCGAEWDTFVVCRTGAEVNCANSRSIGCDASEEILSECVEEFNTRTGCLHVNADGMCPAGQFSFGCTNGIPSGCTEFVMEGTLTYACCPPFD